MLSRRWNCHLWEKSCLDLEVFLTCDFLTPKRISESVHPQIARMLNRQHGTPVWSVQQSSIERTVPPFSWGHSPLKGKTCPWKGPLSWHHNLSSMSHLWWRGKEGILKAIQTRKSHTSPAAMETLSIKSSNFEVWRKRLLSSNLVRRHKDLFVVIIVPFGTQHRISWFSDCLER